MANIIQNNLNKKLLGLLSFFGIGTQRFRESCSDSFIPYDSGQLFPMESQKSLWELERKVSQAQEGGKETKGAPEIDEGNHAPQIDDAGLKLIAEFEGFRSDIYNDVAGYPTIGYGHLLKKGEKARFEQGITKEQGLELLREDAAEAVNAVKELVKVDLNQNQFNALVSFVFNVGRGNFARSTLLKKLNQGQYNQVSPQLMRWIHAGGKSMGGLTRRREAEAALFNKPVH